MEPIPATPVGMDDGDQVVPPFVEFKMIAALPSMPLPDAIPVTRHCVAVGHSAPSNVTLEVDKVCSAQVEPLSLDDTIELLPTATHVPELAEDTALNPGVPDGSDAELKEIAELDEVLTTPAPLLLAPTSTHLLPEIHEMALKPPPPTVEPPGRAAGVAATAGLEVASDVVPEVDTESDDDDPVTAKAVTTPAIASTDPSKTPLITVGRPRMWAIEREVLD